MDTKRDIEGAIRLLPLIQQALENMQAQAQDPNVKVMGTVLAGLTELEERIAKVEALSTKQHEVTARADKLAGSVCEHLAQNDDVLRLDAMEERLATMEKRMVSQLEAYRETNNLAHSASQRIDSVNMELADHEHVRQAAHYMQSMAHEVQAMVARVEIEIGKLDKGEP